MDPRAARSREAMLSAARALLVAEGPAALTHQRVAQQAGVGRATVYRHWPGTEQLMLEVMAGVDLPHFKDPATPVRPWLSGQLRALADELAVPAVAAFSVTLMQSALWDPEMARRRDESNRAIITRLAAAVELAVTTGELRTTAEAPEIAAMLIGPLVYRTGMHAAPVSDALIDRLLNAIGDWH